MTKIIALDATTGSWDTVTTIETKFADQVVNQYATASEHSKAPWVFLKASADATLVELEALINQCLAAYVKFGGMAAAE